MCTAVPVFFFFSLLFCIVIVEKVEVLCSRLAISRATEVHFPQTDGSVRVRGLVWSL